MARCLGALHWPCDHEEKHSAAAKLGWLRRRGALRLSKSASGALERLGFKRAHTDPSHKGQIRFQEGGKWYELPRKTFHGLVSAAKEEERAKRRGAKEEQAAQRSVEVWRKAQHADVIKAIRRRGGIRPDRIPSGSSAKKPPNYEEWRDLPAQIRKFNKRDSRQGLALDDMAVDIAAEFPELRIENGDDLAKYLSNEQLHRRQYRLKKKAA